MIKRCTIAALIAGLVGVAPATAKELNLATIATESSVWGEMIKMFVDRVDEVSGGELTVVPFWGSQLGNQQDTLNMMLRGRLDIWSGPASSFGVLSPESNALYLPYVFRDGRETVCVMDKVGDELAQLIAPRGHLLGYYPNGTLDMVAKQEMRTPEDFKGVKVRTGTQDVPIKFWNSVGAQAVPLSVGELNQSLATNLVTAGEQNEPFTLAISTYSVAPYYIQTGHYYNIGGFVASNRLWDSLSEQEKDWIDEASKDGLNYATFVDMFDKSLQPVLDELKANGVSIIDLTEGETAIWREVGRATHEQFIAEFDDSTKAFYEKVIAATTECAPQ